MSEGMLTILQIFHQTQLCVPSTAPSVHTDSSEQMVAAFVFQAQKWWQSLTLYTAIVNRLIAQHLQELLYLDLFYNTVQPNQS